MYEFAVDTSESNCMGYSNLVYFLLKFQVDALYIVFVFSQSMCAHIVDFTSVSRIFVPGPSLETLLTESTSAYHHDHVAIVETVNTKQNNSFGSGFRSKTVLGHSNHH